MFARRFQAELDAADDQDVEVIQLDRATHDGPHSTVIEELRTSDHCVTSVYRPRDSSAVCCVFPFSILSSWGRGG